jgi:hypothetical protein
MGLVGPVDVTHTLSVCLSDFTSVAFSGRFACVDPCLPYSIVSIEMYNREPMDVFRPPSNTFRQHHFRVLQIMLARI